MKYVVGIRNLSYIAAIFKKISYPIIYIYISTVSRIILNKEVLFNNLIFANNFARTYVRTYVHWVTIFAYVFVPLYVLAGC